MDKEEFKEIMEEGRRRFSIEENTIIQEEGKKQLGEELSSEELIKQKIRLQRELDLPERYDKARRIKRKFKESRKMVQGDEYNVNTNSDLANQLITNLKDIDERSASKKELENLKTAVERFIVEEKDIESPELE